MIAGVDAGATTAYAVLTLEGEVIRIASKKDAGNEFLISGISNSGTPVFIASDTNPPNDTARRLKRAFACRLYYPRKSLSTVDKEMLCKSYKVRNAHERDALSAAIKCANEISSKMRQLHHRLGGLGDGQERASFERIANRMLSGERVHDIIHSKRPA